MGHSNPADRAMGGRLRALHQRRELQPRRFGMAHTYLVAIGAIADMPDALTHTRKARMTRIGNAPTLISFTSAR